MHSLLQKLNYVATVKLPTLEIISTNCSFSTRQQQNFYVHQLLFGLNFMILAHKRRNGQEMACWSFNHFTISCCFVLIVYFQAIHSYSFVLRHILCSLLAIENAILLFMLDVLKYVSHSKHFLSFHLLLWQLKITFQPWMKVKAETTMSEITTQHFIGLIKSKKFKQPYLNNTQMACRSIFTTVQKLVDITIYKQRRFNLLTNAENHEKHQSMTLSIITAGINA